MISTLSNFNPQVSRSGDTITVTYCHLNFSGTCTYQETVIQGTSKKFKRRIYLLTNTDMEDVIEYMYKIGEVTGPGDLQTVSMLIQTHSRMIVEATFQGPDL
jgi:hypothetical protein